MKPNQTIDVADFFKQQLEQQNIEPPAHIWDKVENNIPTYSTSFFNQWWVLNSIAGLIVLSVSLWWFLSNPVAQKESSSVAIQKQPVSIVFRQTVSSSATNQTQPLQQATSALNNKQSELKQQTPLQQTIYYVEASTIGIVEKIEIQDSLRTAKKVFSNLSPNEYGYYELDIHNLTPGKYWLVFYRKDGKHVIRLENFK